MRFYLRPKIKLKKAQEESTPNKHIDPISQLKKEKPKITLEYLLDYFYANTSEIIQETPFFNDFIEYLKTNPNYVNYFKNRNFLQYAPAKLTEIISAQISPQLDFQNYGREIEINPRFGINIIYSLDELDLTLEPQFDEEQMY